MNGSPDAPVARELAVDVVHAFEACAKGQRRAQVRARVQRHAHQRRPTRELGDQRVEPHGKGLSPGTSVLPKPGATRVGGGETTRDVAAVSCASTA